MDRSLTSCDNADEDYIDIEVSSSPSTYFCYSINSPPPPREFEFQKSSTSLEMEPTTSPADELFYKGNLLPLHLPPRLQMVQKLLQNSSSNTSFDNKTEPFDHNNTTMSTSTTTTATTTPFESCNITPLSSCRVSRELDPDEYFFECSTDVSGLINDQQPKKTWSKKLKLIKQSSLGMKLKASRAYLKSLFTKTRCSDEAVAEATKNAAEEARPKAKEGLKKHIKVENKYPFGQIHRERYQVEDKLIGDSNKEKMIEDSGNGLQRRSFSLSIKKNSSTKSTSFSSSSGSSSSSSSSGTSNGFYEVHLLKRCNSANSEIEKSIQGAIAHCKKSQEVICPRKNVTEVGFCSFSASKTCEEQVRPGLCRG